ncbi:hypothetical protein Ancab_026066 [Ancistrocladus abbreviatus]
MEKQIKPKKKRPKEPGRVDPIILKDIAPAHCVENSLVFLKKRKLQKAHVSALLKLLQAIIAASLPVYGEVKVSSGSKHFGSRMEAAILVLPFINRPVKAHFRRRYEMKLTGDCKGISLGSTFSYVKEGCFSDITKGILFQ